MENEYHCIKTWVSFPGDLSGMLIATLEIKILDFDYAWVLEIVVTFRPYFGALIPGLAMIVCPR